MFRFSVIFLLAVLATGSAPGQSAKTPVVEVRTLCFSHASGLFELEAADARPEVITRCTLPLSMLSEPVRIAPVAGKITFYEKAPMPDAKVRPSPLAVAEIPTKLRHVILFFIPASTGGELLYKVVVLNDDPRVFTSGGALVCNLFADEIRFIIGEHKQLLRPGVITYLNTPVQRDDFNMAVVAFQFRSGETWRSASESKLRFVEPMRHLLFTYIDPATRRPRLKTYRDVPLPPIQLEKP
jgi:hypothetical protein